MKYFFPFFLLIIFTSILVNAQQSGVTTIGSIAVSETVSDIMARQILGAQHFRSIEEEKELQYPDRHNLADNPNSPKVSIYPFTGSAETVSKLNTPLALTKGVNFTGATFATTGANSTPPDNQGYVGPTQYIVCVNGQLISYNKNTGLADGALNTTLDNFFSSVVSFASTCDPRIKYDRLSKRWIFLDIDLPTYNNRVVIGVSADSIISSSTVMKFYYFQQGSNDFLDYPTLGVDANAIYIGGNLFDNSGNFAGTTGLVVQKSSIMGSGSIVATQFSLGTSNGTTASGLYTPQGVDNLYDAASTEGYFIGVDAAAYGILDLIRVSNPGTASPTVSTIVTITVPTTASPGQLNSVDQSYYCDSKPGGTGNRLDVDDERLMAAMIRNGHIWTSHEIQTDNTGLGSSSGTRVSARWYDLINYKTGFTPTLNQSGTVYSNTLTTTRDENYLYPTITVNGQGHALMGFTQVGYYAYANAGYTFRLNSAIPGTMQAPDSNTASTTAYNFTHSIEKSTVTHRWGDYSMTDCDPSDDMTFWTIQEFCDVANSYACRITQLKAPAPAPLISATPSVLGSGSNFTLVIKGDTTTGLGFYEPGSSFLKHLTVSIDSGIVVNKVTYNSPSTITLNVTTTGAANGARKITITNPDGQVVSSSAILTYNSALPVELVSFTAEVKRANEVRLNWSTATEVDCQKFNIERSSGNNTWTLLGSIKAAGNSNIAVNYSYSDKSQLHTGVYSYRLKQYDNNGAFKVLNTIEVNYNNIPSAFGLSQNYPNPFNPSTRISFQVAEKSNVNISVYDLLGDKITTLVNETKQPGQYDVTFDASRLASGVYFYKMQTDNFVVTKKMTVVK